MNEWLGAEMTHYLGYEKGQAPPGSPQTAPVLPGLRQIYLQTRVLGRRSSY
jgi:hypothetical protein